MTTIGNHERNWPNSGDRFPAQYDSGGECGVPYERRLQMPRPAEDEPWYSFDFGPIHFLQYSTEHVFAKGRLCQLLTQTPYSGSANVMHVGVNPPKMLHGRKSTHPKRLASSTAAQGMSLPNVILPTGKPYSSLACGIYISTKATPTGWVATSSSIGSCGSKDFGVVSAVTTRDCHCHWQPSMNT